MHPARDPGWMWTGHRVSARRRPGLELYSTCLAFDVDNCQPLTDLDFAQANPYCNGITAPPTVAPTTVAPTLENNCPGYKIQWGAGGPGGPIAGNQGNPRYAYPLDLYHVTCCSENNLTGFAPPQFDCLVYSERDSGLGGCPGAVNWPTARSFCESAGARLCTPLELIQGCGVTLGCGSNNFYIWSSEYNPTCRPPLPPTTANPTNGPTTSVPTTIAPSTLAPTLPMTGSPVGSNSQTGGSSGGGGPNTLLVAVAAILVVVAVVVIVVAYKKLSGGGKDDPRGVGFDNPLCVS